MAALILSVGLASSCDFREDFDGKTLVEACNAKINEYFVQAEYLKSIDFVRAFATNYENVELAQVRFLLGDTAPADSSEYVLEHRPNSACWIYKKTYEIVYLDVPAESLLPQRNVIIKEPIEEENEVRENISAARFFEKEFRYKAGRWLNAY